MKSQKQLTSLPNLLYHMVPEKLYYSFLNEDGDYDCRNRKEWDKNSPCIHTSPSKEIMVENVANQNWINYPIEERFVALIIDPKFIQSKITTAEYNNVVYHHIWGALPKGSFKVAKVTRDNEGKFIL